IFARSGIGTDALRTTTGVKSEISLHSALLDASLNYVAPQLVAGGTAVSLTVISSNPSTGTVQDSRLTIAGGSAGALTLFQPSAPGATTLAVDPPAGFRTPAQFASLAATVIMPGLAVADDVAVGQNLQVEGTVSLGEPAPA